MLSLYALGLKFRLAGSEEVHLSVTYASLPGVQPTAKDWSICCSPDNNINNEHISYIKASDTKESLYDVVDNCSELIQGLIIINSSPGTKLPDELLEDGIPKHLPVYVVSLEDEIKLHGFISAQEAGDVQMKVLVEIDEKRSGLSPSMYLL